MGLFQAIKTKTPKKEKQKRKEQVCKTAWTRYCHTGDQFYAESSLQFGGDLELWEHQSCKNLPWITVKWAVSVRAAGERSRSVPAASHLCFSSNTNPRAPPGPQAEDFGSGQQPVTLQPLSSLLLAKPSAR